jgi:hypothetical protein
MKSSNEAVEEFVRRMSKGVREDMIPKMKASMFVLAPLEKDADIYMALQVGLALMLDKPLFLIVPKGTWLSPRLRASAEMVLEGDIADGDFKQKLEVAISEFIRRQATAQ